jgi:TRAP-type mannitol/chloroaromatic compound transport system permease large subunit
MGSARLVKHLLLTAIVLLLLIGSPVAADVLRLRNGETRTDVWFSSLHSGGAGYLSLCAVRLEGARGARDL